MTNISDSSSTFWDVIGGPASSATRSTFNFYRRLPTSASARSAVEDRPMKLYDKVEEAIRLLSSHDADDQDYISREAAAKALQVLYILRHAQVPPPRIVPGEDGEDVTFTWDAVRVKRLLNIAINNFDVTLLNRETNQREFRKYQFSIDHPDEIVAMLNERASYPVKVSTE